MKSSLPNYIKYLLPLFLILDLLIYYFVKVQYSGFLRALPFLLLGYWYWQNFKGELRFSSIFVFIHFGIATAVPLVTFFIQRRISLNAELAVNFAGNLCFLAIFLENIVLKRYNLEKGTFKKILLPYIILPICFIFFALLPNLNQFYTIVVIIFSVVLIISAIASVYYSNHEVVKLNVTWGMFLIALAHGLNAINLFSYKFTASFGLVYSLSLFAKVLIVNGLIKEKELNAAP